MLLMSTPTPALHTDTLTAGVRAVFAEVTRYPLEILDPEAGLEEDLGIDSVKLGEVFSVLGERFQVPETLAMPEEQFRTIGGIVEALRAYLEGDSGTVPEGPLPSSPPFLRCPSLVTV